MEEKEKEKKSDPAEAKKRMKAVLTMMKIPEFRGPAKKSDSPQRRPSVQIRKGSIQIAQTGSDAQADAPAPSEVETGGRDGPNEQAKAEPPKEEPQDHEDKVPNDANLSTVAESTEGISENTDAKPEPRASPNVLPRLSVEIPGAGVALSEEATTGARLETEEALNIAARAAGLLSSHEPSGHDTPLAEETVSPRKTTASNTESSKEESEEGDGETRDLPENVETASRVTSASSAKIGRGPSKRELSDYLPSRKKHDSRRRFKQVARTNVEDLKKEWLNDPVMKKVESTLPAGKTEESVVNNESVGRSLVHLRKGSEGMVRRTSSELLTELAESRGPRRMSVARRQSVTRPGPRAHKLMSNDKWGPGKPEGSSGAVRPSGEGTLPRSNISAMVPKAKGEKKTIPTSKPTLAAMEMAMKRTPTKDDKITSAWLNDAKDDAIRVGGETALQSLSVSPAPSASPIPHQDDMAIDSEEKYRLEQEIRELERDLKTMARQNKALSRNNEAMNEEIKKLTGKLDSETQRANKAEACVSSVDRVIQHQAVIRIKNKELQLENERNELEKLRAELDARKVHLDEEEARISRLLPKPEEFDCDVDEVDRMILEHGRRRNEEIVDMVEQIRQQREEGTWVDLMIKSRLNRSLQDTTKTTAAFNLAGTEGRSRRGGDGVSTEASSALGSAAGYSVRHRLAKMYNAYKNEAARVNSRKRAERWGDSTMLNAQQNNSGISQFYESALRGNLSHGNAESLGGAEEEMDVVSHIPAHNERNRPLGSQNDTNDLKTKFLNEFGIYFSDDEDA